MKTQLNVLSLNKKIKLIVNADIQILSGHYVQIMNKTENRLA